MGEGGSIEPRAKPVISAGGVLFIRRTGLGARIAVIECRGLASLPRAEAGPGESAETAAMRAAEAFVGHGARLVRTLGETREQTDEGEVLTWFWLASPARGRQGSAAGQANPPEGYRLHWVELEEAILTLESEDEAELLRHLNGKELRTRAPLLPSGARSELEVALSLARERALAYHGAWRGAEQVSPLDGELHADAGPRDLDALLEIAQVEVQRAEERLARGDMRGARRARARAARAALFTLDAPGRRVEFARLWRALPEQDREQLGLSHLAPGAPPELADLLTLHDAAEARAEQDDSDRAVASGLQRRASLPLLASAAAMVWIATAAPLAVESGLDVPATFALHSSALGALGGWTAGSIRRVQGGAAPPIAPFEAALGAAAGLAAGAALSAGFTTALAGGHLAFMAAAVYAAGWAGARSLARSIAPSS
ncbi:MAG: hypothetical protein P8M11_15385 [Planctomycetota bacterium]|nr:hypothetical protein [Planctomycetota bacterium]